jgi:hypothetical protein
LTIENSQRGGRFGKKIAQSKGREKAQIFSAGIQQVSDLRQIKRVFEKIRNLPDLFSEACFGRKAAWRYKVQLVIKACLSV